LVFNIGEHEIFKDIIIPVVDDGGGYGTACRRATRYADGETH
jgi:hypothetical protein